LSGENIKVAQIDAEKNSFIARKYGVGGFPTLFRISNGKIYQFDKARTKDVVIFFAKEGYVDSTFFEVRKEFYDPILDIAEGMAMDLLEIYNGTLINGISFLFFFSFLLGVLTTLLCALIYPQRRRDFGPVKKNQ